MSSRNIYIHFLQKYGFCSKDIETIISIERVWHLSNKQGCLLVPPPPLSLPKNRTKCKNPPIRLLSCVCTAAAAAFRLFFFQFFFRLGKPGSGYQQPRSSIVCSCKKEEYIRSRQDFSRQTEEAVYDGTRTGWIPIFVHHSGMEHDIQDHTPAAIQQGPVKGLPREVVGSHSGLLNDSAKLNHPGLLPIIPALSLEELRLPSIRRRREHSHLGTNELMHQIRQHLFLNFANIIRQRWFQSVLKIVKGLFVAKNQTLRGEPSELHTNRVR